MGDRRGLPWERRDELGPGRALARTVVRVVFSPAETFRQMTLGGNWAEALGFALLVGSVSLWIYELWGMAMRTILDSAAVLPVEEAATANTAAVVSALFAPGFVCVLTVFFAAIVHLLLMMFAGNTRPFLPTFKVFCYSWSVGLFSVVPVCGVFLALGWLVVVWINGVREAHEVTTGQAAGPVLLLMLMVCFCWVVLVVMAMSAASLFPAGFP